MKKNNSFLLITFYITNFLLIILYLYPGSIVGYLLYQDLNLQPQITKNFIISSNHFYTFIFVSALGMFSYKKRKKKIYLLIYLICLSIILEIMHLIIPQRSFQISDLFGNLFGVLVVILFFKFWNKNEF